MIEVVRLDASNDVHEATPCGRAYESRLDILAGVVDGDVIPYTTTSQGDEYIRTDATCTVRSLQRNFEHYRPQAPTVRLATDGLEFGILKCPKGADAHQYVYNDIPDSDDLSWLLNGDFGVSRSVLYVGPYEPLLGALLDADQELFRKPVRAATRLAVLAAQFGYQFNVNM